MLAGLLAAVMVISLAACGNKQSDGTATQSNGAKAQAEQIVLRWNEVNGDGYGATEGAKAFKAKLEEVSGGAMTIDLFTKTVRLATRRSLCKASRWGRLTFSAAMRPLCPTTAPKPSV